MSPYLIRNPEGFSYGYTALTKLDDTEHNTGIDFGILKLPAGEIFIETTALESAFLLIQGKCKLKTESPRPNAARPRDDEYLDQIGERLSCFNEDPIVLHCPSKTNITIEAITDCEFAVSRVENAKSFPATIYTSENILESEHRGKGLLNDTAYRIVRTVFDTRNNPDSNLVLGEVITAPGRWSSYPPHHHHQPEIYHYRFTEPQGYGHAECGEDVFKVKQYDTYKILNQNDHAQAAAPGYGMYYIWVIRHLEGKPYHVPEFSEEHNWTRTHTANERVWKGGF